MLIKENVLDPGPEYDFTAIAPKERIVFFDIETTGLKAGRAFIYLIGAAFYENGEWLLRQYFAETPEEERDVLKSFFGLIYEKKSLGRVILVTYNGDGFDINFVRSGVDFWGLDFDFNGTVSLDLYRKIKNFKKLLKLEDCTLKSVEKFCGIYREDKYSGRELIRVYEDYLKLGAPEFPETNEQNEADKLLASPEMTSARAGTDAKEALLRIGTGTKAVSPRIGTDTKAASAQTEKKRKELLDCLLLHNAEDVADMPFIMDILAYDRIFGGEFIVTESRLIGTVWDMHARLGCPLPKGIWRETPDYCVSIGEEDPLELNITVNLFEGELKSFYVDYKNYYYLPREDRAVHKSLGEFVDRKSRRQATARTCYQRVEGVFVPQYEAVFAPVFYRDYKETPGFGRCPETDGNGNIDFEVTHRYMMSILRAITD